MNGIVGCGDLISLLYILSTLGCHQASLKADSTPSTSLGRCRALSHRRAIFDREGRKHDFFPSTKGWVMGMDMKAKGKEIFKELIPYLVRI